MSRLPVLTLTHSRRSQMLVDPPCNCSAGPASEDYSTWHATILGSAHTPAAAAAAAVVVSRRAQARWLAVRGRRVLPQDRVPDRLPVPAAQGKALAFSLAGSLACSLTLTAASGDLRDEDLPLQHQLERPDLPGHSEGQLEPDTDHGESAAVDLLAADRRQSSRPADAADRASVPARPRSARPHGERVDAQVRGQVKQADRSRIQFYAAFRMRGCR